MELEWLYVQRNKKGEKLDMKMGGVDWKETEIQVKAAKSKTDKEEAKVKQTLSSRNESLSRWRSKNRSSSS